MTLEVYTDGSATIATKPGGFGWVLIKDGIKISEGNGGIAKASNNDAEMEAAIRGLAAAYQHISMIRQMLAQSNAPQEQIDRMATPEVVLCCDSQIVLGWADGTYKFKQKDPDKILKYHALKSLMSRLNAKTRWVKGHSGDTHNERCDKLANEGRLLFVNKDKVIEVKPAGSSKIGKKKTGIVCIWYKDKLKLVDLDNGIVEDYSREDHGSRGSMLEIREEKSR